MSFWKEACVNLRRAVPRSAESLCRAPSKLTANATGNILSPRPWKAPEAAGRRSFSVTAGVQHGHITPPKPGEEINITFIDKDGIRVDLQVAEGDNLLDIAQAHDLEMEGACGGSCACSTCHVIVEDADLFDKMEEPSDDENDMLDLAFGLTETSRLGCQVIMTKDLEGLVVRLPSMTRNLQASDFEQKN
ncbi:2Fe-2S iron-sulfur cluster binding domain protein [Aspergillus heteromorphus CBS 117.55]|uniref:2Fe-2S iron-sulfur cluster binding domain protein n=1 Tax=Aspergillus heteromorphus CBS 117.55 TaxID=1448321 RepID=A0A317W2W0_9EURO|nr:2Fe-2S iron-sulfur cluster binding domain protein [Aspergillus heteromorphus CBS 117.55]PWY79587.1 2Fe-2S iron-sulfur cluster binding domain protein [Aspergillus heteromorphus CBS 117.55]